VVLTKALLLLICREHTNATSPQYSQLETDSSVSTDTDETEDTADAAQAADAPLEQSAAQAGEAPGTVGQEAERQGSLEPQQAQHTLDGAAARSGREVPCMSEQRNDEGSSQAQSAERGSGDIAVAPQGMRSNRGLTAQERADAVARALIR